MYQKRPILTQFLRCTLVKKKISPQISLKMFFKKLKMVSWPKHGHRTKNFNTRTLHFLAKKIPCPWEHQKSQIVLIRPLWGYKNIFFFLVSILTFYKSVKNPINKIEDFFLVEKCLPVSFTIFFLGNVMFCSKKVKDSLCFFVEMKCFAPKKLKIPYVFSLKWNVLLQKS